MLVTGSSTDDYTRLNNMAHRNNETDSDRTHVIMRLFVILIIYIFFTAESNAHTVERHSDIYSVNSHADNDTLANDYSVKCL